MVRYCPSRTKCKRDSGDHIISTQYPRSPKIRLGGIAHLGRIIDKIRLRHAGQIQDYNYLTVGFDRYLLDFLELDDSAFEQRVRDGGTETELLDWVRAQMRNRSPEEIAQWKQRIETSGPMDEAGKARFQQRLEPWRRSEGCQAQHSRTSPPGPT
ncbi:MAG: DUF5069 domain-containing protein [Nitrospirota bacterium]